MKIQEYDRVLWDFNGTILDDMSLCFWCINEMLNKRGLTPLADMEAYRQAFGFPVQVYYARVGLEGEGEGFVHDAHEWMGLYLSKEKDLGVREGVVEALAFIQKAGVAQGILSATESGMLMGQLTHLGLTSYFDHLFGRDDIYAADKSQIARKYRETHPDEKVLMIGDTVHDYETACAGGFDCVLMLGGHQNKATLESCGCPVIEDYEALTIWMQE